MTITPPPSPPSLRQPEELEEGIQQEEKEEGHYIMCPSDDTFPPLTLRTELK
jgi:hypothetical protein